MKIIHQRTEGMPEIIDTERIPYDVTIAMEEQNNHLFKNLFTIVEKQGKMIEILVANVMKQTSLLEKIWNKQLEEEGNV